MTDDEYELIKMIGDVWNKFCALPREHPCEADEFCINIHSLQHKVMARQSRRWIREQEREMNEPRDNL